MAFLHCKELNINLQVSQTCKPLVKAIISMHVYGPFGSNLKICSKFLRNIRLNLSLSTTPITFTNLIYFLNLIIFSVKLLEYAYFFLGQLEFLSCILITDYLSASIADLSKKKLANPGEKNVLKFQKCFSVQNFLTTLQTGPTVSDNSA